MAAHEGERVAELVVRVRLVGREADGFAEVGFGFGESGGVTERYALFEMLLPCFAAEKKVKHGRPPRNSGQILADKQNNI